MCLDKVHLLRIQVWSGLISCCLLGAIMVSCGPSDALCLRVVIACRSFLSSSLQFTRFASLSIPASPSYDSVSWRAPAYEHPERLMNLAHKTFFLSPLILSFSLSYLLALSLFFPSSPPFSILLTNADDSQKQEIMASVQSARANQRASWEKPRMRGEKNSPLSGGD